MDYGAVPGVHAGDQFLGHERRTADLARELAVAHGADPDRAELAALLHDIADHYSNVDLLTLASRYQMRISLAEAHVPKLLHAPVGAEILRREYGVTDEELLDAVRWHTTGAPYMGLLAKILFVANQLDPARGNESSLGSARRWATDNLDHAILAICDWRVLRLIDGSQPVDEQLVTTRNHLMGRVRRALEQ